MKSTQADIVRSKMAEKQMIVLNLLGWTDIQFARFQENAGIMYLKEEFDISNDLVQELTKHKEFWSWWRLQWMRRDTEFIEMSSILFPQEYEDYYRSLHKPSSVVFRPHRDLIRHTYLQMVHDLVKGQVIHGFIEKKEVTA